MYVYKYSSSRESERKKEREVCIVLFVLLRSNWSVRLNCYTTKEKIRRWQTVKHSRLTIASRRVVSRLFQRSKESRWNRGDTMSCIYTSIQQDIGEGKGIRGLFHNPPAPKFPDTQFFNCSVDSVSSMHYYILLKLTIEREREEEDCFQVCHSWRTGADSNTSTRGRRVSDQREEEQGDSGSPVLPDVSSSLLASGS